MVTSRASFGVDSLFRLIEMLGDAFDSDWHDEAVEYLQETMEEAERQVEAKETNSAGMESGAMELSHIPEPSDESVRERINSEEVERMYAEGDETIAESWEIQSAVNSYLWEHWKPTLKQHGIGWPDFQSETKFANNTIEAWASGRQDWDAVLGGHAKLLDAELQ